MTPQRDPTYRVLYSREQAQGFSDEFVFATLERVDPALKDIYTEVFPGESPLEAVSTAYRELQEAEIKYMQRN